MFNVDVSRSNGFTLAYRKVAEFASFTEAESFVRATYNVVSFEADADFPGFADFFTASGDVGRVAVA